MIELDGNSLTLEKLEAIVFGRELVTASEESMNLVRESREVVEDIVEREASIYGITTGFGKLSDVFIDKQHVKKLQQNLVRSHACSVGEPFDEDVSRAMVVLRANALLKGFSGVRTVLVQRLLDMVNHGIHPVIPQQGSLGASGDLAPLSHLALAIMGEGEVFYNGKRRLTHDLLKQLEWPAIELTAKEGLALINGTQAMTAQGAIAFIRCTRLAYITEAITAMTFEALEGIVTALDEDIHKARGYKEQVAVAARLRDYLSGSQLVSEQGEKRIQDAYSLRCAPQVIGASWQTFDYVRNILETEFNAATDNPLIFDNGKVISGGNFHGQPVALAMDFLGIAAAELANISERRIERLVNPQLNDLPPFLSQHPGLESGAMILQYTAASLVSENKTLAHPASVDSIPSSANQEDHVSMGTTGARHAAQIIANVGKVLAIEAFCAMQAIEFRDKEKLAPKTAAIYEHGRKRVLPLTEDRVMTGDIEKLANWFMNEEWNELLNVNWEGSKWKAKQ